MGKLSSDEQKALSPKRHCLSIQILLATAFLESLGFGFALTNLPPLIAHIRNITIVEAASIGGWLFAAFSLSNMLTTPFLSALSDSVGRRPVLVCALAGFVLDYLFLSFATSISMLVVARVIAGVAGATYSVSAAYLIDLTTEDERIMVYSRLGAAKAAGFVIGPAIGGTFADISVRIPFYLATVTALITFIISFLFLQESLSPEARSRFSFQQSNPLRLFLGFGSVNGMASLISCIVITLIYRSLNGILWPYFARASLGWSSERVGISLSISAILGIVFPLLLPPARKWLCEIATLRVAVTACSIGLLGFCLVSNEYLVYFSIVLESAGGWLYPLIISAASLRLSTRTQGAFQGQVAVLENLAWIIVPPLTLSLFKMSSDDMSRPFKSGSLPYVLCALSLLIIVPITRSLGVVDKVHPEER